MDEWKVRILHISDLHERGRREAEPFRRRRVLGEAWKRNLDAFLEDGAIDLVCFTGDVADWGQDEEYASATGFIHTLLQQLALPIERLFLVPGNHDMDRTKGSNTWAELRGKLSSVHPLELSRWMAGGRPPFGLESVSREELLSRQSAYRRWVGTTLGRKELVPASDALHPSLGYQGKLRLPDRPFDLYIVGLDSAWLAGDDHDSGKLRLTTHQVEQLTTDNGEPLPGFRLALVHHPLSDLADKEDCQGLLAERMDLLLRGHLHSATVETSADPDRTLHQLAAGCLYEEAHSAEWPNSCHVIEATLDRNGRPLRYDMRFRSWSKQGHWYDDNSRYQGIENGRLNWKLVPSPPSVPPPSTGTFVGRERELEKLKAALRPAERRPVAICAVHGIPGVGKSYLAARFVELHSKDFPGGFARLVLNPTALPSEAALLGDLANQLELRVDTRLAERCRERLLHPLSLLILENVDSREAADVAVRLASRLQGCPLLVTGRFQGLSEAGGWTRVEVETLDETTALHLLEREFRPAEDESEKEQYRHLARALGYLPLALNLATGYLRAGQDPEGFLEHLREQGLDLEPVFRNEPLFQEDRARAIIRRTFELSLELLRRQLGTGAKAERLLSGLAALGQSPLSGFGRGLGAAIAGLSKSEFGELVVSASLLSLLTRVPNQERRHDTWRVHPLLAELLREDPSAASGFTRMTKWFLERLTKLPPGQEQEQGERWKELHLETNALVDWLQRVPREDYIRVWKSGAWVANHMGPFPAWMDFCERALQGPLSPTQRSLFLWTFANVAIASGALDRALAAAQEKEELDQTLQAPGDAARARAIQADILRDKGQLDEALRIFRQELLPTFEQLGDVHSRAAILSRIADILRAQGNQHDALLIYRQEILPLLVQIRDVHAQAVTLTNIADILHTQRRPDEALSILEQQVIPIFDQLNDVRSRARTRVKVADILHEQGKPGEALRILEKEVLPVLKLQGDTKEYTVALGRVADIRHAQGDLDEALRIQKQEVIPVFERLGLPQEYAVAQGKLADILQTQGKLDEALRIRTKEEIPVFERLGAQRDRAVAMGRVADILLIQEKPDEALRIHREEQLPVFEQSGDVLLRAMTLGKIADILRTQGKLNEARQLLLEQVIPTFEWLGEIRFRAIARGKVADCLHAQSELDEALRIRREEELPVYEQFGDMREHAVTLAKIADILHAKGQSAEALQLLTEQVLPIFEQLGTALEQETALRQIARIRSGT